MNVWTRSELKKKKKKKKKKKGGGGGGGRRKEISKEKVRGRGGRSKIFNCFYETTLVVCNTLSGYSCRKEVLLEHVKLQYILFCVAYMQK